MTKTASDSSSDGGGRFDQTRWTIILILAWMDPQSPEFQKACEEFCQAYWKPIYLYVLKWGRSREEAEDLTQEFFLRLLKKRVLAGLTKKGGKFRSFLLTVLKRFLASNWRPPQKDGGGMVHIPFEEASEACIQKELSDHETPEVLFDRKWAQAALAHVLRLLKAEYEADGKGKLFECLKGRLPGSQQEVSYEEASRILGKPIEAVREATYRLRQRGRELLRQEVATPGMKPSEIDEEIRYLLKVLGHK